MNGGAMSDDDEDILLYARRNLVHYQLWNEVEVRESCLDWKGDRIRLLTGIPPRKLSNDDVESDIEKEFVLPVDMSQYKEGYLTLECVDKIFENLCDPETKRIVLAIVNDDGTIVFYFMYKGIHKPKRN